ncbi:ABC transporter ATP-binding protein [Verrucosispora sp. TAA-831]|uniref:ABC transporter ATP-binding protein n=1 Tax=Verrucosispora sp. TAA-831 TaxID=3422227 RepID=UPI003D6F03B1
MRMARFSAVWRGARSRLDRWLSIARLLPHAGMPTLGAALAVNVLLGLLPIGFIVATSVMVQRLAEAIGGDEQAWRATVLALGLAALAFFLQQVLAPAQTALGHLVTWRVDAWCTRSLMTSALVDAPISALEDATELDRLSRAREAFGRTMPTPGDAAAGALALLPRYGQLVGAVVVLWVALSPWASLVAGVTALVVRFGQRGALGRFGAFLKGLFPTWRHASYVRSMAAGAAFAKEIRVFGLIGWVRERHRSEYLDYLRQFWAGRRRINLRPFLGYAAVGLVGATIVFVLIAQAAAGGRLSVLELGLAVQAALIPIRFGVHFPESDVPTQYGLQSYEAMTDFARSSRSRAALAAPVAGESAADRPEREVRFEQVRFRYAPQGAEVLRGLDLRLPAGRSTAIVGLNGAGKTTLVKLLTRLYDPVAGRITVDGRDLREYDVAQWQSRIAVVFQDFVRLELSAAENVDLAAGAAPDDESPLWAALDRAGAREVVEGLDAGLRTTLSSRYAGGQDLSGGQWQRVALARAMRKVAAGASMIVLDEPTSQLDVRAEVDFFDRFLEISRGLTTVVISHRFSTVRRADHIVVVADGVVQEQGTHDELVAAGGSYATLFRLQADRFVDAEAGR